MKNWHWHEYRGDQGLNRELARSNGVIYLRHRHQDFSQEIIKNFDKQHSHEEHSIGWYDKSGLFKGTQIMPIREKNFSLRQSIWPSWICSHKWYDVLPIHQMWLSHSKRHYNSSGIENITAGLLILMTQGFKISIIIAAFFLTSEDNNNKTEIYVRLLIAMGCLAAILLSIWFKLWIQDISNCIISIINWWLYVNGWLLSAFTLFSRINPRGVALIPVLLPPGYVFLRTLLFFPMEKRREAFLLAAISNRSVPLGVNFHVVGPSDTYNSHRFLSLINVYSFVATFVSKGLVFALESDLHPIIYIMHAAHFIFTLYSALFQIRCRQISLDSYVVANKMIKSGDPKDSNGKIFDDNLEDNKN